MKSVLRIRGALLLLFLFFISTNVEAKTDAGNPEASGLMKKVLGLQIPFIENQGQISDKSVKFYANTFAGTVFVTDKGEIVYSLIKAEPKEDAGYKMQDAGSNEDNSKPQTLNLQLSMGKIASPLARNDITSDSIVKTAALRESLVYSNQRPDDRACLPPACRTGRDRQAQNTDKIKGINKAETKVNYFKGSKENWRTNIPTWQEVSLGEVYKGIELKLKAYGKNVEKLFTVHPEGSVDDIRIGIEGAKKLIINKDGEIEVGTEIGTVKFTKPVAYQEEKIPSPLAGEGKGEGALQNKQYIKVAYVVDGNEYGFKVGDYDRTKPLIIDPFLAYSTYLGGSSAEYGYGIAVAEDNSGNIYIYVSGKTNSTTFFPFPMVTPSGYDPEYNGSTDVFVAKINASGTALLYLTYLGGDAADSGCGSMTIDSYGNVYVTGTTYSTEPFPFPTTPGAYDSTYNGGGDAFITKISADGTDLVYSTYLGGTGYDYPCGWSIAVDNSGNAYVVGETDSTDFFPFPMETPPGYDSTYNGGKDVFVAKINATGSALVYFTYLGGDLDDASWAIDIDSDGNAYISGKTTSTSATFFPSPMETPPGYDSTYNGAMDAFVAKINDSGTALVYFTYLGGDGADYAHGIAVDSSGNAYVTGRTTSTGLFPFPTTLGAYDSTYNEGTDAFVTKINTLASVPEESLVYSTYLGGSSLDYGWGIVVDSSGNAYLTGYTNSTNFPTVPTACPTYGDQGGRDVFVTKINASGSALVYSTYLGGGGTDEGWDIAIDSSENIYVTGTTYSTGLYPFPTTPGAYDSTYNGAGDAFVAKISSGAEVCDGIDNDCNSLIDDGIPSTPTTCGVGACASTGTLSCVGGTMVDSCTPGAPSTEVCNGIDDDCNGAVDEGFVDADNDGYAICAGDCNDSNATINPGAAEICDNINNDCDTNTADGSGESWYGSPTICGTGACASTGILSCVGGALVDTCLPGAPTAEGCDGNDDDCNGLVDDGLLIRVGAVYYSSLQTAYNLAEGGSVIQTQDVQLIENLNANILNKTVTIDGGYGDCSYAAKTGRTRLKGQMTISNGKAAVKDFIIEQ